jgi:hypothetical protein
MIFAIGLFATIVVRVLTSERPTENTVQQEPTAGEARPRGDDEPNSPSADFAALINAIATQGGANREEEKREDNGRKFREWLTIILLMATVYLLNTQVTEMRKVYDPITRQAETSDLQAKTARDEYIANQRAWIGPTTAEITQPPISGQVISTTINYINSGKSPAGAGYYATARSFTKKDWNAPPPGAYACRALYSVKDICMGITDYNATTVVWPNISSGVYGLSTPADADSFPDQFVRFNDDLKAGDAIFVLIGCFVYNTASDTHHTAFCYYAQPGKVQQGALSICHCGNGAD